LDSSGHTCVDIDECNVNIHGCAHKCLKAHGFYNCSCDSGYALGLDGRSCNGMTFHDSVVYVYNKYYYHP
jgi:fibulin 1/2